jgi:hypothetical protein
MIRMRASREFAIDPDDETNVRRGTKTRVGDRRITLVLIGKKSGRGPTAAAVADPVRHHFFLSG